MDKTNTNSQEPRYGYTRGYLPHYDDQQTLQFITFRLADSLPKRLLERFKAELDRNIITEIEFHRRVDKYLDTGYGNNYLRNPKIADMIVENLHRFAGIKYRLCSWVVMPNHVHVLLEPLNNTPLIRIMHSMKSYTSHHANKILNRTGRFWSKDYFDRYIRNGEHFAKYSCVILKTTPLKPSSANGRQTGHGEAPDLKNKLSRNARGSRAIRLICEHMVG